MPKNASSYPLADPDEQRRRKQRLAEPHVQRLAAFVYRMRRELPGKDIPHFDPEDGGSEAEILFLLKAPGSGAMKSGFISRDNPDPNAKNGGSVNAEAGLDRKRTVSWNVVPWVVGSNGDGVVESEARRALPYLDELVGKGLLPKLRTVVLFGAFAQKFEDRIRRNRPGVRTVRCPMPAPQVLNTRPGERERIVGILRDVARSSGQGEAADSIL